ncbi:hypothetical protein [Pseudonocardia pini]|nr:hypothetical protein [Pseudonocardia pini]
MAKAVQIRDLDEHIYEGHEEACGVGGDVVVEVRLQAMDDLRRDREER